MQYLLSFAEQDDVQAIANQAMRFSQVQGVVVEVDDYWIYGWRIKERYGEFFLKKISQYFLGIPFLQFGNLIKLEDYWIPNRPLNEDDFKWEPPGWKEYIKLYGAESTKPFIIKVCLYPTTEPNSETPQINNSPYRIIYETRPPAYLYTSPKDCLRPLQGGVSTGTDDNNFGTLGGFLKSDSNEYYGVTCSHLITTKNEEFYQPALPDGKKSRIGKLGYSTSLVTCPSSTDCKSGSPYVNELDIALIKIDDHINIDSNKILKLGTISKISKESEISPSQACSFTGRSSGHQMYREIKGIGVVYNFTTTHGDNYCFRRQFEVSSTSWWNRKLSSPTKPGDSGSWVCIPHNKGNAWAGLIFGGDGLYGFATFSEEIQKWWQARNLNLSLL